MGTAAGMKLRDWKARLARYLDDVRTKPFAYGDHDCALFAAGAIEAQTGENPAKGYDYSTLKGGLQALKANGHETHLDALKAITRPVERHYAQRGDIAVVDIGSPALGVVTGAHVTLVSERGLIVFDLLDDRVKEVFRI